MHHTAAGVRSPDDLAGVVYAIGLANGAAKGTKVLYVVSLLSGGSSLRLGRPCAKQKEQRHPYQGGGE